MNIINNRSIRIWLIIIALFSLIFLTFSVININSDFTRHGQEVPVNICGFIECDEITESRFDNIVLPLIAGQKQEFVINNTLIASLQLSTAIFQPPERNEMSGKSINQAMSFLVSQV